MTPLEQTHTITPIERVLYTAKAHTTVAVMELLQSAFGKDRGPCRMVYGVSSLRLGTPVELEVIFKVED